MVELIQRYKWWLFAVIFLGGLVMLLERWRRVREQSQDEVILAAATRYGVDAALVKAVVWRESWFNPRAKGSSGEIGLMQIREPTARDWAEAERLRLFTHFQLYDPAKNTRCGAWYLSRLLARYRSTDNPLPYALAAYNAGPAHVARWRKEEAATNSVQFLRQMDFPGTRQYVEAVTQRYRRYRKSFRPKESSFPRWPVEGTTNGRASFTIQRRPLFAGKAAWREPRPGRVRLLPNPDLGVAALVLISPSSRI